SSRVSWSAGSTSGGSEVDNGTSPQSRGGLKKGQAIGNGHGLNRQVFPSALTTSGSNCAASLFDVENVCCIMTGARAPCCSQGSWCRYPMAWPTSWLITYCREEPTSPSKG